MSNNNQIKSLVDRIEKLEDEKSEIAVLIKDVYAEAKSNGFDPKIIKRIISIRRQDAKKRAEEQALLDVYMDALGMLADTPLGKAALAAETNRAPSKAPAPAVDYDEDDDDF